jgi:CDP-4-dehydro-6-deoxyglucose reductase
MKFNVRVVNSGHEFMVEENEFVLEAAIRQGIALPYGCRNGACGKCAGDLMQGEIGDQVEELRGMALDEHAKGKTMLCKARPTSDLEIRVREITNNKEIDIKTLPCRVDSLKLLTHDIMQLQLKLPENERLQFLAGQYLEIILKDGRRRAFSIANAPHDDEFIELHIRHVPDGEFGDFVFAGMKEKAILRIQGPLGSYYLREESPRPVILVGGGTGFAPLKGMLEHAFHIGFDRPMHLFCGVRAKRDLYMDKLASQWVNEHNKLQYTAVLSEQGESDDWQGTTGFVHDAVTVAYPDLSGYDVYLSGPPPMIKAGMDTFYAHALPESQIYSDSFEYSDDALKAMGIKKPKA